MNNRPRKFDGIEKAQEQVTIYLSDSDYRPLREMLAERLKSLDTDKAYCISNPRRLPWPGAISHV